MEGKEAIIKKILSDAESKAIEIIDKANNVYEAKTKESEDWAKEYTKTQNELLDEEAKEIIRRKLIVADLDVRKNKLKAKQQVIDKIFLKVKENLLKMPNKKYLAFVEELLVKYAEEGDTIILSNDKVLTVEMIKNLSIYKEKNLRIADKPANFLGGVKLEGKSCDKDLSFDAIISDKREELASYVASSLF